RQLKRLKVLMGEYLGQILHPIARLTLDPSGRRTMAAGPLRARDLAVGDVADEQVPERVLALAFHRAHPSRANELLTGKLVQGELKLALVAAADLGQSAHPEHLPQPGCRWYSSGRAVQRRSRGTPSAHSDRCSRNASSASSAQCKSSNTSTLGRAAASPSRNRRQAVNNSCRSAGEAASTPTSGASR